MVYVWERKNGKRTAPYLMQYVTDVVPRIGDIFTLAPEHTAPRKMLVAEVEWVAWPNNDRAGSGGDVFVNLDVWDFADMDEVDDVEDA